ncbi:MAG: type I-C CRISPR-associated protein Cas8c/Csd1 [Tepidisphaeraceae bacterium]
MLQELIEYAQREGLASEPGFKTKAVKWVLTFDPSGRFTGVLLQGEIKGKGRDIPSCPDLSQPEMISLGRGTRHFLVDSLDKVVLLTKDEVTDKLTSEHNYFVGLLRQAAVVEPVLGPIADVLSDAAALESIRSSLLEQKAKPTDGATVAVSDSMTGQIRILVEGDLWRDWWRDFRRQLNPAGNADDSDPMLCLLSGKLAAPAKTHPKISGLSDVGGLSMGDALTSFDKDAFTSFDLVQGRNAAVSADMAAAYTGALNHLIRNRSHRLAGVKVVYWYNKPVPVELDLPKLVLQPQGSDDDNELDDEDTDAPPTRGEISRGEGRARKLLEAIDTGVPPDLLRARFFALTLSANSGRVVVRDWMSEDFADLHKAVRAWFGDLAIVHRNGFAITDSFKFMSIVGAGVRDLKDATAAMQTSLWQAALFQLPIPDSIAAMTLRRAQLEIIQGDTLQTRRFALLKAFLIRKDVPMTEQVNDDLKDPAYLCGRIMALLAHIQRKALGDVGAGLVQRYYAAASATPALVLGRLIRTANTGHIPKIEPAGLRDWYQQELAGLWSQLRHVPPATLSLTEQTLFAMGYYQQLARRGKAETATDFSDENK